MTVHNFLLFSSTKKLIFRNSIENHVASSQHVYTRKCYGQSNGKDASWPSTASLNKAAFPLGSISQLLFFAASAWV